MLLSYIDCMQNVSLSISDDGVKTIVPQLSSGLMTITVVDGSPDVQGIVSFSSSSVVKSTTASDIEVTTGVLTGTDGSDAKLTISVSGGKLYIENRLGSSKNIHVIINT